MSPTSSNVPFVVTLLPPPFSYLYRRRRSRSQPINTAGSWSPSSSSSSRPTLSLLGRAFLNFGLHISKHQIRVLLICCLVITLLAYPALAIHYRTVFASRSAAGADLSGMEAGDVPEGFSWGELQSGAFGWEGEGWEVSSVDERAAEAWGGSGRVRMERIWIAERDPTLSSSSSSPSPSKELLNATAFACALREAVPDELNLLACYPRINVPPLDDDPVRGARAAWNCYLREEMGSYAPFISSWDEDAWQNAIKQALIGTNAEVWGRFSGRQTVYHVRRGPPTDSPRELPIPPRRRLVDLFAFLPLPFPILLLYGTLLGWTFLSLRSFTQVHSRFGISFTYVAELACSTTCSGSICVIMGWKLEGIPWYILPFVIAVIGLENMQHVTRCIVNTPITLPVSERTSLGLANAGPTITFTTLSDIALLTIFGAVAGERVGVVREFCRFAIIVLIADWFLIFTLFCSVLTIDMQRLELADVLNQGPPMAALPEAEEPASPIVEKGKRRRRPRSRPKSSSKAIARGFQAVLRARTARNGSLFLLLGLGMGLWAHYGSELVAVHTSSPDLASSVISPGPQSSSRSNQPHFFDRPPDPETIWPFLSQPNQKDITLVLPPSTAVLVYASPRGLPFSYRPFAFSRPFPFRTNKWLGRSVRAIFLGVVLPSSITTFLLWLLLRFLLKDAELLDAQRGRLELGEEWEDDETVSGQDAAFAELPKIRKLHGLHQADVSVVATSADGSTSLTVGFDGIAVVWGTEAPDVGERLLYTPFVHAMSRVVHAAVDAMGLYCALAFSCGTVLVWWVPALSTQRDPMVFASTSPNPPNAEGVTDLGFVDIPASTDVFFSAMRVATTILIAAREDGSIFEYDCGLKSSSFIKVADGQSLRGTCLWKAGRRDVVEVAFTTANGQARVLRRDEDHGQWKQVALVTLPSSERLSKVTSSLVRIDSTPTELLATTTDLGTISLWEYATGRRLVTISDLKGRTARIRVVDPAIQRCGLCFEKTSGFVVLVSTAQRLSFYRVSTPDPAVKSCTCSPVRRSGTFSDRSSLDVPPIGNGSRKSSLSFTIPPSPNRPLVSVPSSSSLSDYPIAGHGVHSRRISTRERRSESEDTCADEIFDAQETLTDDGLLLDPYNGGGNGFGSIRPLSPTPPALQASLLGSISIMRGGWELLDGHRVVGLSKVLSGLSALSEEDSASSATATSSSTSSPHRPAQWQVFHLDLHSPTIGLSTLNVGINSLSSLPVDVPPPPPSPSGSDSSTEGSSLRRRRRDRTKRFSASAASTTRSSRSMAVKMTKSSSMITAPVSHSHLGPLAQAGPARLLLGTGNALALIRFPPPAVDPREDLVVPMLPPPPFASPLRRKVSTSGGGRR